MATIDTKPAYLAAVRAIATACEGNKALKPADCVREHLTAILSHDAIDLQDGVSVGYHKAQQFSQLVALYAAGVAADWNAVMPHLIETAALEAIRFDVDELREELRDAAKRERAEAACLMQRAL